MIWATVSSRSCFCWLYRASPSLAAKNIINLISVLTMWWCPCVESSHVLLKEVFAMTSVFSWQNSIRFCPASFRTPKPNLPVTPGVSCPPIFFYSSPLWWKGHLFWVLVLEGLVDLHRAIRLQLLQHYWLGRRLGLLWYWMACLGNEQRSFCCFWVCIQVLHFRLFCGLWWLFHFFYGFLPTVVDIMDIWVKLTHSSTF